MTNFLRVLARHGRLDLLPAILREARLRNEMRQGRRRVQVTSARPLDSQAEGRIRSRLAESLPFEPILETRVDPSLIGRNRHSGRRHRLRQFARDAHQAASRAVEAEESP